MTTMNDMFPSKYLSQDDCGDGINLTIQSFREIEVGNPPKLEWAVAFREISKPFVINRTKAQMIHAVLRTKSAEEWSGKQICLYVDPTVTFGGRVTGGIRVRPVQTKPSLQAKPAPRQSKFIANEHEGDLSGLNS